MRLDGHEVFVVVRNRNHVFFSYNYSSGGGAVWSEIAFHPSCEEENGASVEILWKCAQNRWAPPTRRLIVCLEDRRVDLLRARPRTGTLLRSHGWHSTRACTPARNPYM
jgi:predicted outer membrane repeat protein